MLPKVYIETTIVSYLTALPTRDLIRLGHQLLTQEWWAERARYELFASPVVVQEASAGDPAAAARRHEALRGLTILQRSAEATHLAGALVARGGLPAKAAVDALHVAIAVVNGMDYLLTWNCTHIANATMRGKIEAICRDLGFEPPVICTPEELTEE